MRSSADLDTTSSHFAKNALPRVNCSKPPHNSWRPDAPERIQRRASCKSLGFGASATFEAQASKMYTAACALLVASTDEHPAASRSHMVMAIFNCRNVASNESAAVLRQWLAGSNLYAPNFFTTELMSMSSQTSWRKDIDVTNLSGISGAQPLPDDCARRRVTCSNFSLNSQGVLAKRNTFKPARMSPSTKALVQNKPTTKTTCNSASTEVPWEHDPRAQADMPPT